jgi:hypothetical protein
MAGIAGGVEQAGADGRVPRPDRGAAVLVRAATRGSFSPAA